METAITLALLLLTLAALTREVLSPDVILLAAVGILVSLGIVDLEAALAGFANPTLLAIGSLFVIAEGLRRSGVLRTAGRLLLGSVRHLRAALLRLTATAAASSAFLNNTPIVAIGIPTVLSWAEEQEDITPSKLLIPLSYASILGGLCTLVGTSTNLVADGMLRSAGYEGLGFFELARVGLPLAVVGIVALVTVVPRFLPERTELHTRREEEGIMRWSRGEADFLFTLPEGSPLAGKPAGEARGSGDDLSLVRISREATLMAPVSDDETLREGDYLTFRGDRDAMARIAERWGLERARPEHNLRGPFQLREAVIPEGSPLVGERVGNVGFPSRFGALVTGVFRHGAAVELEPERIRLRAGDTLLLEATEAFSKAHTASAAFYLVGEERGLARAGGSFLGLSRGVWGMGVLAMVVLAATSGLAHISVAALAGAVVMVATGFLTPGEARESIDWSVLLVIGGALGLGAGMEASGAAALIADGLVVVGEPLGAVGVLAAILFGCSILTELITNNAALALLFPVAISAAESVGADPRPFVIAVTVAASLSFATPLGYQTNLMVYGPGGYRFTDLVKVGVPLQIAVGLLAALLIPLWWPL